MRYRFSQLKIDPRATVGAELKELLETALAREIRRKTGMKSVELRDLEIIRESIDARNKPDVKLVYTVDFDCNEKLPFDTARREEYRIPPLSEKWRSESAGRPAVVGFGPCGMFAALVLAEAGLRPIVIERGKCVKERAADVKKFWTAAGTQADAAPDPESNVQFGEGGAGTLSDGKLTTGIKDIRIRKVLPE